MLVLDENLPSGQRALLRQWRIRFRAIGAELGESGTKDENLISLFHRLRHATFISLDRDFYRPELAHDRHCLVWLNVKGSEAVEFIRRFLKHPAFNTRIKRMGLVARVHPEGVSCLGAGRQKPIETQWRD